MVLRLAAIVVATLSLLTSCGRPPWDSPLTRTFPTWPTWLHIVVSPVLVVVGTAALVVALLLVIAVFWGLVGVGLFMWVGIQSLWEKAVDAFHPAEPAEDEDEDRSGSEE